jgi:hypothetical protein
MQYLLDTTICVLKWKIDLENKQVKKRLLHISKLCEFCMF